ARGVAADVAPAPPGHSRPLDRAGVGRSGAVCPLVVSAHRALGVASLLADQYGWDLSAPGQQSLPASAELCAAPWHPLAGARDRLCESAQPLELYPVALLGGGLQGCVVHPDRFAAREQRSVLVRLAGLDRAGLQDYQTRGLAVAADPPARSRARGPRVGWSGRGRD